jgi:hypothetical protein
MSNERDEHYCTANNLFRDLRMAGETLVLRAAGPCRDLLLAQRAWWRRA